MAAVWTCNDPTCGKTLDSRTDICPKCGGAMRKVGEGRGRGVVLIVCGVVMLGMMGPITYYLGPDLREAMATGSSDGFTGTAEQARLILYLFYALLAFGAVALANGIYQTVTSTQNRVFVVLNFVIFAIVLFFVFTSMWSLKGSS